MQDFAGFKWSGTMLIDSTVVTGKGTHNFRSEMIVA